MLLIWNLFHLIIITRSLAFTKRIVPSCNFWTLPTAIRHFIENITGSHYLKSVIAITRRKDKKSRNFNEKIFSCFFAIDIAQPSERWLAVHSPIFVSSWLQFSCAADSSDGFMKMSSHHILEIRLIWKVTESGHVSYIQSVKFGNVITGNIFTSADYICYQFTNYFDNIWTVYIPCET